MSFAVQSFPELYTTLIGWHLYDQLWTLLHQTGIAFVPFIFIILRNIAQPYVSQEAKDATSTSLRRMEIDILATLFLIMLAVAPAMPLNADVVSYTPTCPADGNSNSTYHPGDTGTTWDSAFTLPNADVHVPVWWYAVISLSSGITAAANTMVSCPIDYRGMIAQVNTAQITDPALKQEVQQFTTQCFIPARTQYLQDSNHQSSNSTTNQTITNDRNQYGSDDTEWVGSHSFQDTYYQNLRAQQPVQGFAYQASEDINADVDKAHPPAYGTPDCATWWNDPQQGLKQKLNQALPNKFWQVFNKIFPPDSTTQDNVLKNILTRNGYQHAPTTMGDWSYSHIANMLGDWLTGASTYPKIYAASEAGPIIQALLLLMVYVFLPFALVFSGYRPAAFITGAIIIFSLIFWSFIWQLIQYADSALMQALYGNDWFGAHTPSAVLADMITELLILIAPLFWFAFMGAMGIALGNVVNQAFTTATGVGDTASAAGVKATKDAAQGAVSLLIE